MKELFERIYLDEKRLLTENLVKGEKVYGEKLVEGKGKEFREWNPFRSKLAAAIKNGLKEVPLREGNNVLYLGSSEGTTASHISDIIGLTGILFGVEVSAKSMQKFLGLCEKRKNLVPVLEDANFPERYEEYLEGKGIDLLYQDISQKNQAEIFLKNAKKYLEEGKFGLIAIKARSIDSTAKPSEVFPKEIEKLKKEFKVIQVVSLKPFDKAHVMVLCEKK